MRVLKTILCELTGYSLKTVDVSQGDNQTRAVSCRLMENGAPWAVPEGVQAEVAYVLPNGTPGRYRTMPDGSPAATIDGSTVTVLLIDRIMAQPGAVECSVVLTDASGGQLATFPFRVNVIGGQKLTNPETYPALGAEFEGKLLFGGSGGVVVPLTVEELRALLGGWTPETPEGVVTAEADESGALRVYLDGVEVVPVVDEAGDMTWPGLELVVDESGDATLKLKEA